METKNIMIVGVGGQGSLLASKLLGRLLLTRGYDIKVSEVHGMSQRGGSVVTYVRFGDKVYSPVIITGAAAYPENLVEKMQAAGVDVDAFDALGLAEQAGSSKAVNIVLMGHLSNYFDFSEEEWLTALEQSVPAKFLELNRRAFQLGRNG